MGEFGIAADHVDDDADLGAVDVGVELALGFNAREAAERHVFADLANEALADFFKRGIADLAGGEGFDVGRVLFGNGADGVSSHLQEFRVLGNEVRFGVDSETGAERAIVGQVVSDDAFGSDAGGGLRGLVAELDAKDFLSLGHVAVSFREGLLAFHHRGVRLDAQFLDHRGGNSSHVHSPRVSVENFRIQNHEKKGVT